VNRNPILFLSAAVGLCLRGPQSRDLPNAPLAPGDTLRLRAGGRDILTECDLAPPPAVTWVTSDDRVLRVSSDGLVQAVGPGTATISARARWVRVSHELTVQPQAISDDPAPAQPPRETAAEAVTRLYRAYAWETNPATDNRQTLFGESADVMRRYLDSALVQAVLADRACQRRTEGICNLDFVPLWNSQDPGSTTWAVRATRDSTRVEAHIRYPDQPAPTVITYRLRRTRDGWRVVDLSTTAWPSLLALLRTPLP
jgi:hypothetical protein